RSPVPRPTLFIAKPTTAIAMALPSCSTLTCLAANVFPSLRFSTRYVTALATVCRYSGIGVCTLWTWKPGGMVWWAAVAAAATHWGMS
ncbi:MAG: hypothetical protein ALECFALPRED_000987, partial [Alectoria fallacina]